MFTVVTAKNQLQKLNSAFPENKSCHSGKKKFKQGK
jgi:hypothetical protein